MKAKYAGKCSRTGQSYRAGTEITKGRTGWEIAGAAAKSSSNPQNHHGLEGTVYLRVDGEINERHFDSREFYCKCAKTQPGFDTGKKDTYAHCQLNRVGETLVCQNPACGKVYEILNDEQIFDLVTLPKLHFCSNGELSDTVGPARWATIKQYFEYESYAAKAERLDDMDDFEEAAEYEGRRGGEWTLRKFSDMERVEEILGIRPENRRAVRAVVEAEQEAKERAAATEAARIRDEREANYQRLFQGGGYIDAAGNPFQRGAAVVSLPTGQRIKRGDGFNIYGSGTEFHVEDGGEYVWLLHCNGMDGDDWSSSNTSAGIGYRFPLTPERLAFLTEFMPDLPERLKKMAVFAREVATGLVTTKIAPPWSSRPAEWKAPGARNATAPVPARFEIHGESVTAYWHQGVVNAPQALIDAWVRDEWTALVEARGEVAAARSVLGDQAPGPVRLIELEGVDKFVALARREPWLMCEDEAKYQLPLAEKFDIPTIILKPKYAWPLKDESLRKTKDAETEGLLELLHIDTHPGVYLHPDGRTFASVHKGQFQEFVDVSHYTPEDLAAARTRRADATAKQAYERQREALRKIATKSGIRDADKIKALTVTESLGKREKGGTGNGSLASLDKATARFEAGSSRTLYRVEWTWWSMGEDGDADTTIELYAENDLAAAKERFKEYASY